MGAGDADYSVAQALNERLDIHGDEGFVLDDQDVGRDLGRELPPGFFDQTAQSGQIAVQNLRSVLLRKALERDQQESLARTRRDLRKVLFGRKIRYGGIGFAV